VKKKVNVGEDFDVKIKTLASEDVSRREMTRAWIAKAVVIGVAIALVIATCVGFRDGSFDKLQTVWNVASGLLLLIMPPYFGNQSGGNGGRTLS